MLSRFESGPIDVNTKRQGAIGIGRAVQFYMDQGFSVFTPVSDVERYDLIVDKGKGPLRVEVKTTTSKNGNIELRTSGGNKTGTGIIKHLSSCDSDLVVLVDICADKLQEMPTVSLDGRTNIKIR